MSDIGYFSMYARFETESKEDAAAFLGADNIIGDAFSIEQEYALWRWSKDLAVQERRRHAGLPRSDL